MSSIWFVYVSMYHFNLHIRVSTPTHKTRAASILSLEKSIDYCLQHSLAWHPFQQLAVMTIHWYYHNTSQGMQLNLLKFGLGKYFGISITGLHRPFQTQVSMSAYSCCNAPPWNLYIETKVCMRYEKVIP